MDISLIKMNTPFQQNPIIITRHFNLANCEECVAIPLDYFSQKKIPACDKHREILKKSRCADCNKKAHYVFEGNVFLCSNHIRPIIAHNYETLHSRFFELALTINEGRTVVEYLRDAEEQIDISGITEFIPRPDLLLGIVQAMNDVQELRHENQPPPPNVTTELGKLAYDKQNVHTQHINTQTDNGLKALTTQPIPPEWNTMTYLQTVFKTNCKTMLKDISKWYETTNCRNENDNLYAKALDGLLVIIDSHKHKKELYKRFKEEAVESIGMCCEGHLSRLCNVLVGFDDRFNPPIPVKEILQQKMANIASQDIPIEQKVFEAYAVFLELKIPEEEHSAWLDAF